jgi:MazG family protein
MPDNSSPSLVPPDPALPPLQQLRGIVAQLRGPGGCPWDREQSHASLRGGLLEEAYEVVEAIDAADDANLREELGDLLLQVVFHSQLAEEEGRFDFDDCARAISEKLVRRHPHVYAAESAANSSAVLKRWDQIKREEKGAPEHHSILEGISEGLPALLHAEKIQKRAGKVGLDWAEAAPVIEKVREELAEVEHAITGENQGEIEKEIGDLLFAVVNLARKLRVEPEVALRRATRKFATRFRAVETMARERGLQMEQMTLAELDVLWDEVKRAE